MHALIQECKPLDQNSCYAYLLLCEHFADTCVLAEAEGKIVGFVSAYTPPGQRNTVFVWQVAVRDTARGLGLGGKMIEALLNGDACASVTRLQTTVSPSNQASARMFEKLAERLNTTCTRESFFGPECFPDNHEEEILFTVGPFGS